MKDYGAAGVYKDHYRQAELFLTCGFYGVKIHEGRLVSCSRSERYLNYTRAICAALSGRPDSRSDAIQLVADMITAINQADETISDESPLFKKYFKSAALAHAWNSRMVESRSDSFSRLQLRVQRTLGLDWKSSIQPDLRIVRLPSVPIRSFASFDRAFTLSFVNKQKMPLVISPVDPNTTREELSNCLNRHRATIKTLLKEYGAVLLRGFPVTDAESFASVLKDALDGELCDYLAGEGSRTKVVDGVYTSTEAPGRFHIPLHNELSCTQSSPDYICFYCAVAPEKGTGRTLLGKTLEVTRSLQTIGDIWDLFKDQRICYTSRHPPNGSLLSSLNVTHKTWQQCFDTTEKSKVEAVCREKKYSYKWLPGDWLEVTRTAPAVIERCDTVYWFNQAYLYDANPEIRGGWVNHILASLLYWRPSTRQYSVRLEDDTLIPRAMTYRIYDILRQQTVEFDWEQRDVLIVDNFEALHGRSPSWGSRKILTAMVRKNGEEF